MSQFAHPIHPTVRRASSPAWRLLSLLFLLLAWSALAAPAVAQEAEWIWVPGQTQENIPVNTSSVFRRTFDLGAAPELAQMIITADDGDRHKPNPDPILQALGALGADAGGACYVGDAPFDIRAGNAAGTTTIAVTWGFFTEGALSQEHPDRVCHSVDELRAMLLGPS